MNPSIKYSLIIPTYKRPDVLVLCLQRIAELDYDQRLIEVHIIDNAEAENTAWAAEPFQGKIPLTYHVNERNLGPGGSLTKGLQLAKGERIVLMNDDALVPPSFLKDCDATLDGRPDIGALGFRVIEKNYHRSTDGVGTILDSGEVVGNFDIDTGKIVDVEHIYGFCYLITRQAMERGGVFDRTLLSKPYASGNRIETDQCLSIRRAGFRVVYNPAIVAEHLAKPRPDYNERSLRWKLNDIRNTLYLFLKHYGLFGKRCLALRYTFLMDVGILSLLKRPNRSNFMYFFTGLRARCSAFGHYFLHLAGL